MQAAIGNLVATEAGEVFFRWIRATGHPRQGTAQTHSKQAASRDFTLLQTVPGIGDSLGLTIFHEIGDIARFPTVKDFLSYCRLVKGTVASAGKFKGLRGRQAGQPLPALGLW